MIGDIMLFQRTIVCCMVFIISSAITLVGQAAMVDAPQEDSTAIEQSETVQKKSQAPIVIEGDKLYFNDKTGEVYAQGDVKVTQDIETILSQYVRGNTKSTELWIDDKANYLQGNTNLIGNKTHYNYGTKYGTMQDTHGKIGNQIVAGENLEMEPEKLIIHDGTMTKCPAKVPDYHISADRLEIWPGDKYIAYNAKFWIKNTVIYSMSKYQGSLKEDGKTEFPQIGYDNSDGFFVKQYLEYPLSDKLALSTELAYFTKAGFKPNYGMIDRERNYSMQLKQGNFQDSDGSWIKKEPEWRFDYHKHYIGSSPISYTFTAIYGKWTDESKTSWHQDYKLYFTRDAIPLNDSMNLYLGTGLQQIRESYNQSTLNSLRFDAKVTKTWSEKWNSYVGYHYTKTDQSIFDYDKDDLGRRLDTGFSYKIDNMNTIAFKQSYDLKNDRVYDQDYYWYRNLHCWQATLEYRAKRHEFKWLLTTKHW